MPARTATRGVVKEHRSSAGLLLALLGQDAMRRLRDAHEANGLNPRQFELLGLLHDHGPTGQSDLGQTMGVDRSVLVTLLNPLERAGLVERRRDDEDRRCHVVTLTGAGGRRLDAAVRAQREAEHALFDGLGDREREQLRGLLVALRESGAGGSCR